MEEGIDNPARAQSDVEDDEDFDAELERELAGNEEEAGGEGDGSAEEMSQLSKGELDAVRAQDGADSEELTVQKEARRKQAVLSQMTEEQLDRYEAFRRSSLQKKNMKRLLQSVTGLNPNTASSNNSTIILCGIAKMFVGELVEEAKLIALAQQQTGPLQPSHIHAAFQRLDALGKIPHRAGSKRKGRY